MDALEEVLSQADIVVSSTSAMQPVVTVKHLERRKKARRGANLFFIDLAVPRDVAPEVGELDGVFLYDVDDLAQVAAESAGSRKNAAKHAEQIVEEGVAEWARRENAQAVTPTIKALRAKMRRGLEEELHKSLRGRLRGLDEEQRVSLAKMLDAGLNRILHGPVTRLRAEATREDGLSAEDLADLLSELFELTDVPEEDLDVPSIRIPDDKPKVAYLSESTDDPPTESKAKWKNDAL
jgi:glutamyl-tRNA reductase